MFDWQLAGCGSPLYYENRKIHCCKVSYGFFHSYLELLLNTSLSTSPS